MARAARPPKDDRSGTKPTKLLRVAGLPAVAALFAKAPHRVERLFFDQRMRPQVSDFCAELARAHKPFRLVPSEELERVAGSVMHGGIVALARPQPLPALDLAKAADWARGGEPLLLLDGIGNPHNLGAILRSAAYFGVAHAILAERPEQALPSASSYRVAEGALEHLLLYRATLPEAIEALRRSGFRAVGTSLGRAVPLADLRSEKPVALVLGNEEHGVEPATLALCDVAVTIPGATMSEAGGVQSLNAAAAAAILLYVLTSR
jgi:TrmH RNA methyltransferase